MPTILDINAEARALCDADTNSYPAATLLRRINAAYERIVGWLINADGTWEYDDSNYTDLPIGTQTLTESQSAYTFNDKFLQLLEVQVKNKDGNWIIIKPIDQKEITGITPLSEIYETDGFPQFYDKVTDDTIKFYPAPTATDVTLASGLKIRFKRTSDIFTSAEVTTGKNVPGFVSTYHYILSYMAAIPYCMSYKKDRVALYERKVGSIDPRSPYYGGMAKELIKAYSSREKDKRKKMTMLQKLFR